MSAPTFEEILKAWTLEYDEYIPNERRARIEAFIVLLGNLQDHGFGKEELNTSKKEKIVRSCVNPNYRHKQKLKSWISMVLKDYESAIQIYYKIVKIRTDVMTPEMSAQLESMEKRADEVKALKKSNRDEESDDLSYDPDKPLDLEGETLDIDNAVKDVVNNPRPETFEITDDLFEDNEGPNIVWDEDFMKKLESGDE